MFNLDRKKRPQKLPRRPRSRRLLGEQLESRCLLASDLIISEFQASNTDTLLDADGDSSDWIEIFNRSKSPVQLADWSLTDDPEDLGKWQFPAYELGPGEFLVVFASDKLDGKYVDDAGNLHTSFELSASGEYLALIEPDGETIASEFGPAYPEQHEGMSYGSSLSIDNTILIGNQQAAEILVPESDELELAWTDPDFVITEDWITQTNGSPLFMPIGAELETYDTDLLAYWRLDEPADLYGFGKVADELGPHDGTRFGTIEFGRPGADSVTGTAIYNNGQHGNVRIGFDPVLNPSSFTIASWVNVESVQSFQTVFSSQFSFVANSALGYELAISDTGEFAFRTAGGGSWDSLSGPAAEPGQWTFVVATFDAVSNVKRLFVDGTMAAETSSHAYLPSRRNDTFIGAGGNFGDESYFSGSIDDVSLWGRALNPSKVEQLYLSGLGDGPTLGYSDEITTDLSSVASDFESSIYVRIPFEVSEPSNFDRLSLELKYDDGVVAFLNGQEIARRNVPSGPLSFSDFASVARLDADVLDREKIDLTPFLNSLRAGQNSLAVHLLDSSDADLDRLLSVQLTGALIDVDETLQGFFEIPSPGESNETVSPRVTSASVLFSQDAGVFTESFDLSLTASDPTAEIRYTTDGSVPTEESPVYDGPIGINTTTTLRARAFAEDAIGGSVATRTFVRLGQDLSGFGSELPIVVIDNLGNGQIPNPGWNQLNIGIQQVPYQPASLIVFEGTDDELSSFDVDPRFDTRAGIRVRGASSSDLPRPGYSLEFWGESGDSDVDLPFLGMSAESDWVLISPDPASDLGLIDNAFLFELSKQMGFWAPEARYVEAFVNTDGGDLTMSDYVGLYVIVEKVKRTSDRLDFEPFSVDAAEGGWLLEINRPDRISVDGLPPKNFHTAGQDGIVQTLPDINQSGVWDDFPQWHNAFFNYADPNGYYINRTQQQSIHEWLLEMESVLFGRRPDVVWNDPVNGYVRYIDVDSFIDYYLLHNLAKNADGLQLSMWLYNPDPAHRGKLSFGPLWDTDLGSFSGDPTSSLMYRANELWFGRLFDDPDFTQSYIDRWQQLRADTLSDDNLAAVIETFQEYIGVTAAERHGVAGWGQRLDNMLQWVIQRSSAMDATMVPVPEIDHSGGIVPAGTRVLLSAIQGDIYYTLDGTDPRAYGGNASTTANLLAGEIVINESTTLVARTSFGTEWSSPVQISFIVDAVPASADNLIVSEINYHPVAPSTAELLIAPGADAQDFEFIELTNVGAARVNVADVQFVDGVSLTLLSLDLVAGERAVVVRNSQAFRARYGLGPRILGEWSGALSNGGERLTLVDASGQTVFDVDYEDSVLWPEAADGWGATLEIVDTSRGRESRGKYYNWRASRQFLGTPGAVDISPHGIVINEVLANSDAPGSQDAIELVNVSDAIVDVSGWYLSDSTSQFLKYAFPEGTMVGPGEYLVVREDQFNPAPNNPAPHHFSLDGNDGDDVWLVIPDGQGGIREFVDEVHFAGSLSGVTLGRLPDGLGRLTALSRNSLGYANRRPFVFPLTVSEIKYSSSVPTPAALAIEPAITSDDLQYIELYNDGLTSIRADGYRIDGGVDYVFPLGLELQPTTSVVIVSFDPMTEVSRADAFRSHYGIPVDTPLLGPFSGRLNERGERIALWHTTSPGDGDDTSVDLVIDEIVFDSLAPWAVDAAIGEMALSRRLPILVGNEPTSWQATFAAPGVAEFIAVPLGDLSGDGIVDAHDIDTLIDAIALGHTNDAFDMDGSGEVTLADLAYLVESVLGTFFGDANLDGVVDGQDFSVWYANRFQSADASWSRGDFSGDYEVDGLDFHRWWVNRFAGANVEAFPSRIPRSPAAHDVAIAATSEIVGPSRAATRQLPTICERQEVARIGGIGGLVFRSFPWKEKLRNLRRTPVTWLTARSYPSVHREQTINLSIVTQWTREGKLWDVE